MNELEGFTLYKPPTLYISIRKRTIGIARPVVDALGKPEFINLFFDEHRHRVMIKAAERGFQNTLRISQGGNSGHVINSAEISGKLKDWYGQDAKVPGHVAGDGIVIFELER